MCTNYIDILIIQETHKSGNTRELGKWYSWYYSGGPDGEFVTEQGEITWKPINRCFQGVAIIVDNTWRNYILDIATPTERLMIMKLRGKVDIHIIAAYAPTAA